MPKIKCTCTRCGKTFERWPHEAKGRVWCSQSCHMKDLNAERNPTRWKTENRDREAHRAARVNRGEGKTYRKRYGDKRDNRPENLKIYSSQAEHMREGHRRAGGRWSK